MFPLTEVRLLRYSTPIMSPTQPLTSDLLQDGVTIRRHPRARRISLRIDPHTREVILTLPQRASERNGIEFLRSKSDWVTKQLATLPQVVEMKPGALFPLFGVPVMLEHAPTKFGLAVLEEDILHVPNPVTRWKETLEKSFRAMLMEKLQISLQEMRQRLFAIAHIPVQSRNRTPKLRWMRSRWGSCGPDGELTFNLALIFAPHFVVDYVVAHEVAHLRYRGHGPRFWALVEQIYPRANEARRWLRSEGASLYSYYLAKD